MTTTTFAGRYKVATRIYTGFIFVLALLVLVVGLSYRALTDLEGDFHRYALYSSEAVGVLRVKSEVADIRRQAVNYVNSGDEKAAVAIREAQGRLRTEFRSLNTMFKKPERVAMVEQMSRLADEYGALFGKVEGIRQRREELLTKQFEPLGTQIRVYNTKIQELTAQSGDAEAAALSGRGIEQLMLGRIRVLRFLDSNNDAIRADARKYFDEYRQTIATLANRLGDGEAKRQAGEILNKLGDYLALFDQVAAATLDLDKTTFGVMAPLGVQFAAIADKLVEETGVEREKVQDEAEAAIAASISTSLILAIASLLAGVAFAVLVARSITRPVVDMTASMTRLAAGDLAADVPATGNHDEIGEMAKAVLVFKENAIQKKRMDEAEAARLAAERAEEEAERQREQAVGAEIAGLIDAVSKGDLDRRIDMAGKDGFYKTMSEGVNRLTDTVQAVISDVGEVLSALAAGDLTKQVTRDYQGAFARMKTDVNATSQRLAGIVGDISAAAETISTAASEVSSGSTDLAERTEQQASSLEETAASMEQLSGTVRSNADNAQRANRMAEDAKRAAESGGGVAGAAIDAMKRIEDASRKITDIISVIDEIAFQTNLLALNAAVEAARAGDAGRGFAVVAQEVRQLAQRSAQASKEIKALILDSDGQVKEGVDLVKRAGDALGGIVDGINQVASLIADMASASGEQASALDEINAAVAQMDEMTQKNAALVEETTAAAHAMADQSRDLQEQISFFKVDGRGSGGATRRPAAGVQRAVAPTISTTRLAAKPAAKPGARLAAKPAARPAAARPTNPGASSGNLQMEGALKRAAASHDDDDDWKEF